MRRLLGAAGIGVALLAVGCSSASANAVSEVRAACGHGLPGATGGNGNETWGEILATYQAAQMDSAKAVAADPRWDSLNSAYGTLISAWGALVAITGPDITNNDSSTNVVAQADAGQIAASRAQWSGPAGQAEATVRSQCAIAKAS